MIYTSGAPRTADPTPWDCFALDLRMQHRNQCRPGCRYDHWNPRSEYALPPRHDANPYLVALRDYLAAWPERPAVIAREWLALHSLLEIPRRRAGHTDDPLMQSNQYHYGHALRVLSRLAALG